MSITSRKKKRKIRKFRSKLIKGNLESPRLVISKSNRYLTAQVIDDEKGHTLIYLSTANLVSKDDQRINCYKNQSWAEKLGKLVEKELQKKAIKKVIFDRNGYPYHGKIKSFGEIMYENDLWGKKK